MNAVVSALARGAVPAAELRGRLGTSPATLMRMVRAAQSDVVRIGRARATRYALRQVWPTLDTARFPLFRIDDTGTPRSAGELATLAARQSVWMPDGSISDGLPVALLDARPSGFLGRHFASAHPDLRLPARLDDWSDHHILLAMSRRGEDLTGDLIVGEESFARWQDLEVTSCERDRYPYLAEVTIAGHPPGSSAGGERPKFGVLVGDRHVLVKFAARGTASDTVARRWCDLLILEETALAVVRTRGIATAHTTIIQTASHCFLESERFDRVGTRGRVAVLSLAAVHDNLADTWARAAASLTDAGRISREDGRRLRWLDAFGALIGNTDRHQYNVLFFTGDEATPRGTSRLPGRRLRLAPAFDQVSMWYAPSADGQVSRREFIRPKITPETLDEWGDAQDAARAFWSRGADDARLSDDCRTICARNAQLLRE